MKRFSVAILFLLFVLPVQAEQAKKIMEKVDRLQRELSNKTLSLSSLSTCDFAIKNKQVVCTEEPRIKVIESLSKQLGPTLKDSQSISIILEPAREKGIGMLTYSYDDAQKDTESWLYLSALGKVKRMASGSGDDQEPVSLFGSEFTTEDMETGKTDEYSYKILQEGKYQDAEVWVIEATPKPVRLRKTQYSRLLLWIDKDKWLARKVQSYDRYNKLYKRIIFQDFEKLSGSWIAKDMTIYNMRINRLSRMLTEKIALDVPVDDAFLTQRSLIDFAFREKNLTALRAFLE
ncbi:MAG: outer membrane lipoprotein-sorting protein [Oleiphilus sp.]